MFRLSDASDSWVTFCNNNKEGITYKTNIGTIYSDAITTNSNFYDDAMLDYLLKDVIKEKAEEATKTLNKEIEDKAKKRINDFSNNIKKVVFNDPATVIVWKDGHKTVVKCGPEDKYDKEKGFAIALIKELLGNIGYYNEVFKKWVN